MSTMADSHLPEDLVIEILIRLPVKSILKFRCVSKYWLHLTRSSAFIDRHMKHDRRKRSVLLVERCLPPLEQGSGGAENLISFHDPDFPQVLVSPNLSIPIQNHSNVYKYGYFGFPVYGPCNGLVCVEGEFLYFCNPALRQFRPLPPPNVTNPKGYVDRLLRTGFGFDPNTGAYKVVRFWDITHIKGNYRDKSKYPLNETLRIDLYNSASNSWKQIESQMHPDQIWTCFTGFQLFFSNAIHWVAIIDIGIGTWENLYILCFDTITDEFRAMDYPDNFDNIIQSDSENINAITSTQRLLVLNENLAMVSYKPRIEAPIHIWVMKEYGVKESWTRLFVIGPYIVACPLLFLRNEWLLFESNNGQLAACAIHENRIEEFQFYGLKDSLDAVVYEESLISLDMVISGDDHMHYK